MTPTLNAPLRAKSILDAAFRYRPSHATHVCGTFERVTADSLIVLARPGSGATAEGRICGRGGRSAYTVHAASN